jgi:hypothetical protein
MVAAETSTLSFDWFSLCRGRGSMSLRVASRKLSCHERSTRVEKSNPPVLHQRYCQLQSDGSVTNAEASGNGVMTGFSVTRQSLICRPLPAEGSNLKKNIEGADWGAQGVSTRVFHRF